MHDQAADSPTDPSLAAATDPIISKIPTGTASTPQFPNGRRAHIPELDGIRGLAILLVFIYHFRVFKEEGGAMSRLAVEVMGCCWCGVDLFFVLSGFLITGILLDTKHDPRFFTNFYGRRTLRIFPLYFLAAAVIFLVVPAFLPVLSAADRQMLSNQGWVWCYGTNVKIALTGFKAFEGDYAHTSHFWSLAVEEHFYLVWPFIVYFASARLLRYLCMVCLVGVLALRLGLAYRDPSSIAPYVITPCRVDTLAAGGLLSLVVRNLSGRLILRWTYWPMVASATALLVLFTTRRGLRDGDWPVETFGYSFLAVLFVGLIGLLLGLAPVHPLRRCFRWAGLRTLGKYSYGLYVIHGALVPTFQRLLTTEQLQAALVLPHFVASVLRIPLVFIVCFGLALASWTLVERYPLRLKRYF